jgi:hypothetical protein
LNPGRDVRIAQGGIKHPDREGLVFLFPEVGKAEVFCHTEIVKNMNQLEGSYDAALDPSCRGEVGNVFASVIYLTFFRHIVSGKEINEGRFSSSIGPDDSQGLSFDQFKINLVDGDEISKSFGDTFTDQHRLGAHTEPLGTKNVSGGSPLLLGPCLRAGNRNEVLVAKHGKRRQCLFTAIGADDIKHVILVLFFVRFLAFHKQRQVLARELMVHSELSRPFY